MAFPAGAFFTIFAGLIRMSIELTDMSEYKKKNDPAPIKDIGIFMDLLEFVSSLGILVCIYIIVFTSEKLTDEAPYDDYVMYVIAFGTLHFIFILKYILAELIEDEPEWIRVDKESMENRVAQVENDNQDKKLYERLSKHYSEMDLLFEVLSHVHSDLSKSGQLVPKLKEGLEDWIAANKFDGAMLDTQKFSNGVSEGTV